MESLSNDTYSVNYRDYGNPDVGGYATTNVQRLMEGSPVGQFYVWEWAGYNEDGGPSSNDYDAEGNLIAPPMPRMMAIAAKLVLHSLRLLSDGTMPLPTRTGH